MIDVMSDLERVLRRLARLLETTGERDDDRAESEAADDARATPKPEQPESPAIRDLPQSGAATG
jgi:hypothetical protein